MVTAFHTGLVWWGILILGSAWSLWKNNANPSWVIEMLQISAASATAGLFFSSPIDLGLLIAPPAVLFVLNWGFELLATHPDLLNASAAAGVTGCFAATTAIRRAGKRYPAMLPWVSLYVPLTISWFAALAAASAVAELKIRHHARELDATCVATRSFISSLGVAGQEYAPGRHAFAIANGQLLQWSYRLNRFYPSSPHTVPAGMQTDCPRP
ncbi:MAG: hypothetical protein AB3N24_06695 [Leisingera sp.]